MEILFIDAKYKKKDFYLSNETIKYLKKFKIIAIYSSIQFVEGVEKIIKDLNNNGIEVTSSIPDRASVKYQILGCDCFKQNLKLEKNPEAFLYIGDGLFHPKALSLAQKDELKFKEVISYDPTRKQMIILKEEEHKKIFKKYRGSLMKFIASDNIGILITTKPGQQQFNLAKKLKEKYPKKKFYFFADNDLKFDQLENFNFIECWVNTACPRIGFDDSINLNLPLLNITDALKCEEILGKESLLTKS